MKTQAVEDYLKAIFLVQEDEGRVTTNALAARLDITAASTTGMIKKLAALKLVHHEPYQGVTLTSAGRKAAVEVIRHHRLLELYLAEALGVPWDRVHEEAEKLEHVLSEELEQRMDEKLGYPTADPHGQPIPSLDGEMPRGKKVPLEDLQPGNAATISEVHDRDAELLRYLGELGLFPNATVHMVSAAPFDGPLTVRVNDEVHAVGREVARHVFITEDTADREASER